jgi:DNA-binding MarR family transcriptional regulator
METINELLEKFFRTVNLVNEQAKTPWDFGIGFPLYNSEVEFLAVVAAHSGANAGELARYLGVSNAAVSQVAKKLLNKGLLETYRRDDNRKEVFFRLTGLGKKADRGHKRRHKTIFAGFFDYCRGLDAQEFGVIIGYLDALAAATSRGYAEKMKSPNGGLLLAFR